MSFWEAFKGFVGDRLRPHFFNTHNLIFELLIIFPAAALAILKVKIKFMADMISHAAAFEASLWTSKKAPRKF